MVCWTRVMSQSKHKARLRRAWFDRGVEALNYTVHVTIDDDPPGLHYACPLCFLFYGEESLDDGGLTLEDVPPKSVGGKPMALTCQPCNSTAGTKVDAHADKHLKFTLAKAGIKGTLEGTINDGVHAEFDFSDSDAVKIFVDGSLSNPAVRKKLEAHLDEMVAGAALDPHLFDVKMKTGFKPEAAGLSYLRAAYLVLFAKLGYRAVLSEAYLPLRQQLQSLDTLTLPWLPTMATHGLAPGFYGAEHESIGPTVLVVFEHTCVALPGTLEDAGWWERSAVCAAAKDLSFSFSNQTALPTEPMYEYDFKKPKKPVDECAALPVFGEQSTMD